jgi:hypothetical protein
MLRVAEKSAVFLTTCSQSVHPFVDSVREATVRRGACRGHRPHAHFCAKSLLVGAIGYRGRSYEPLQRGSTPRTNKNTPRETRKRTRLHTSMRTRRRRCRRPSSKSSGRETRSMPKIIGTCVSGRSEVWRTTASSCGAATMVIRSIFRNVHPGGSADELVDVRHVAHGELTIVREGRHRVHDVIPEGGDISRRR